MDLQYAIIGTWNTRDTKMGITVCRYDAASGTFGWLHHYDSQVKAGSMAYDRNRKVLYAIDEREGRPGDIGGGGFLRAYAFDEETGELHFLNEKSTLMPKPAYVCLDPIGEYVLVACHSGRGHATKVMHTPDGGWTSGVVFDDAGVVLYRLDTDGSLGEICDVALHQGLSRNGQQVNAHVHSITASRDGQIFYACDKGLDRIFSYKISRETGKLLPMAQTEMEVATCPRYSAFHPNLPVWYENNETGNKLYAFSYAAESGLLSPVSVTELFDEDPSVMPSDLAVHPSGRYLYASIRQINEVVTCVIDPVSGALSIRGRIKIAGSPRGLAISPDGCYLFALLNDVAAVAGYRILGDGTLARTGFCFRVPSAANLIFT